MRFREKQNTENEKTRKETLKKGEQEIGGTRKKTQETKEKRGKRLKKKRKSQRIKIYYNKMRVQRKID